MKKKNYEYYIEEDNLEKETILKLKILPRKKHSFHFCASSKSFMQN